MSSRDALARGLALAFLAGPWTSTGLLDRGERTLGERPRWLSPLVREMMARFEAAPNDAYDRLREAIERASSFNRGLARAKPRSNLRTVLVSEPSMGPRRWPVPILCTLPDLASWLAITTEELEWFADVRGLNGEVERTPLLHYSFTWLPKRRGGYRLLEAPKTRLKELQRRVLTGILSQVPPHDAAHGFVTGRSALSFARVHAGQSVILRMDLEDFFPSLGAARVYRVFRSFGYPEHIASALTGICTLKVPWHVLANMPALRFEEQHDTATIAARTRARQRLRHRHLAQGAPTSPALANLASYRLDARLAGAAAAAGAKYTRYADDLAFSGDAAFACRARRFEALVAAIALEERFRVHHHKTRVMRQSERQKLVGLITNQRPNVPRRERERLEALLTNAARSGLESQNRDADPHFLESLRGRVAWIAQVNPAQARKLSQLLEVCERAAVTGD
jgi:RNA-directed DNA polymerase